MDGKGERERKKSIHQGYLFLFVHRPVATAMAMQINVRKMVEAIKTKVAANVNTTLSVETATRVIPPTTMLLGSQRVYSMHMPAKVC